MARFSKTRAIAVSALLSTAITSGVQSQAPPACVGTPACSGGQVTNSTCGINLASLDCWEVRQLIATSYSVLATSSTEIPINDDPTNCPGCLDDRPGYSIDSAIREILTSWLDAGGVPRCGQPMFDDRSSVNFISVEVAEEPLGSDSLAVIERDYTTYVSEGSPVSIRGIKRAKIRINPDKFFYFQGGRGDVNEAFFPTVLAHELGHAMGLGHASDCFENATMEAGMLYTEEDKAVPEQIDVCGVTYQYLDGYYAGPGHCCSPCNCHWGDLLSCYEDFYREGFEYGTALAGGPYTTPTGIVQQLLWGEDDPDGQLDEITWYRSIDGVEFDVAGVSEAVDSGLSYHLQPPVEHQQELYYAATAQDDGEIYASSDALVSPFRFLYDVELQAAPQIVQSVGELVFVGQAGGRVDVYDMLADVDTPQVVIDLGWSADVEFRAACEAAPFHQSAFGSCVLFVAYDTSSHDSEVILVARNPTVPYRIGRVTS